MGRRLERFFKDVFINENIYFKRKVLLGYLLSNRGILVCVYIDTNDEWAPKKTMHETSSLSDLIFIRHEKIDFDIIEPKPDVACMGDL